MVGQSPARFKWATFVFWNILDPAFRAHFRYYRKRRAADRYLERLGALANVAIGVTFGLTLYQLIVARWLLPPPVGSERTMAENANEVLRVMGYDATKELPAFLLMRAKREIIGKLHVAADKAEVKRRREEVQRLQRIVQAND
ncbi:hypothetical protein ERJ75_001236800 [Trypanosoma vivax]|nr:hypothetical protein TRVL_00005 [Trypanosoma vivax]KAH8608901.1 hypothetical protein ERJ75_001236800 [Trypanosoma vivax]